MISAEETKQQTLERRQTQLDIELQRVNRLIQTASSEGKGFICCTSLLSVDVIKALKDLGYVVTCCSVSEKGKFRQFSVIRWT